MTEHVLKLPLEPTPFKLPSLSPALDSELAVAYRHFSENTPAPQASFDHAAAAYFDTFPFPRLESAGAADMYFNSFTPIWVWLIHKGRYADAAGLWEWALRPALQWESQRERLLHKGSAFYFAAISALLVNDLDGGFLLAHAALEEDVRTHGHLGPQTPSLALATLNPQPAEQLFRSWVASHAALLDSWLRAYRERHGRTLSLDGLRQNYLLALPNRENAFLLAYVVARLQRLTLLPAAARAGVFASQLHANVIFDLALLLDQAIPCPATRRPTFLHLATALSTRATLGLSQADLAEINTSFNEDFDGTLVAMLDHAYRLPDGRAVSGLAAALAVSYGCRNRGAHTTSASHVAGLRFDDIRAAVMDAFFLAVEVFPPNTVTASTSSRPSEHP